MYREQTVSQLLDETKLHLLLAGGVENWEGYDEALRRYSKVINEYNKSHPAAPNVEILYALEDCDVDNWEWYGEALRSFGEYSDYVEDSKTFPNVLSFQEWKQELTTKLVDAQKYLTAPKTEADDSLTFSGNAEKSLYSYIVQLFGESKSREVFLLAKGNGFWTGIVSPKSYDTAIQVIKKGVDNPIEKARAKYLELIIKNGSLDKFLKSLL